jgi:hypothetical protein
VGQCQSAKTSNNYNCVCGVNGGYCPCTAGQCGDPSCPTATAEKYHLQFSDGSTQPCTADGTPLPGSTRTAPTRTAQPTYQPSYMQQPMSFGGGDFMRGGGCGP